VTEIKEKEVYQHSKFIMASYGSRELFGQWVGAAFGFTVFFFYEAVIGLNVVLAAVAFVIYNIWNAINDPLTGYMMEHFHFPWEKKAGYRRMPFIIGGAILWLLCYLAIFLIPLGWDPVKDQWLIFSWYLITLCIYDTFGTLYDVNAVSLYPDKFLGLNERRTVQGFGTILGIIGLVLAAIIPPLFITTGEAVTYRNSAMATLGIGLILFMIIIPGIFEDKKIREQYKRTRELMKTEESMSFFKSIKIVLSNKTFTTKMILFFGYQVGAVMLQTSAFYITTYILDSPALGVTLLLGSMLIGALVSVPIWTIASQRLNNNRKLSLIGGFFMFFTFIPMIFVTTVIEWVITLIAFGIGLGGQWFMDPPTTGDVLDEVAVKSGKRQPGLYYGWQAFIIKLGQSTIAITIAIVHTLTGFVEGAPSLALLLAESPTPELAIFGIRIHSAIVPAILVLITTLVFWKYYKLTPDKVAANKEKLKEMGV